jgi:uncharacterized protein YprB with RNaseH-like and TPR domain
LSTSATELPLGLEVETRRGLCWRMDAPVEELWPEEQRWLAALNKRQPALAADVSAHRHPEIIALRNALPDNVALIDVETAAIGAFPIFLAGALHVHKGLPIVTQLVARSEEEEPAVLTALDEILTDKQCLLTFSRKHCDWPALRERRQALDLGAEPWSEDMMHCDLLVHARRRWRARLPNCTLQTLELHVCGRQRSADAFDRDAADAHRHFQLTGATRELRSALHHQAMDIITMWQLALWMAHA